MSSLNNYKIYASTFSKQNTAMYHLANFDSNLPFDLKGNAIEIEKVGEKIKANLDADTPLLFQANEEIKRPTFKSNTDFAFMTFDQSLDSGKGGFKIVPVNQKLNFLKKSILPPKKKLDGPEDFLKHLTKTKKNESVLTKWKKQVYKQNEIDAQGQNDQDKWERDCKKQQDKEKADVKKLKAREKEEFFDEQCVGANDMFNSDADEAIVHKKDYGPASSEDDSVESPP